jgi:hypothetical protein
MSAQQNALVGTWRLVSSQATVWDDGDEDTEVFHTVQPKGYLIVTPWGRMMTVSVACDGDRTKKPTSGVDLSELWKTMMAYTGKYRVEGGAIVTTVDVAWNEAWTGTVQKRYYKLEGDKLTIDTEPLRIGSGRRAKALYSCRVVWEREGAATAAAPAESLAPSEECGEMQAVYRAPFFLPALAYFDDVFPRSVAGSPSDSPLTWHWHSPSSWINTEESPDPLFAGAPAGD